jgi:hypothetical protein
MLELARRSYAAFGALDADAIVALYDPHCEFELGRVGAAVGVDAFKGHKGLREFVAAIADGVDGYWTTIDEARVTLDRRLLLRGRAGGRSSLLGMELAMESWQQLEFRGERILRVAQLEGQPQEWEAASVIEAAPALDRAETASRPR